MNRSNRLMVLIFIAAAFGVVFLSGIFVPTGSVDSSSLPHIEREERVWYVVDGDTIIIQGGEEVRLVGVNTPETSSGDGLEAKEFVEGLCPSGKIIGLDVDDLGPADRYGRTIAVVYVKIGGCWVNLNAELLRRGYAEVMFIPPSEFNPYQWLG